MTAEVNHTGTTGMKYDGGKPRPGLLFKYAMAGIRGVIAVLEFGAKKYAPGSWVTVPEGEERYFEAAQRHFMDIQEHGLDHLDHESGLLSLDHLLCDLLFVRQLVANRPKETCDTCEADGIYATDGSGPFDCFKCGKKVLKSELKVYDLIGGNKAPLTLSQFDRYWEIEAEQRINSPLYWNNLTPFGKHQYIMAQLYKEEIL